MALPPQRTIAGMWSMKTEPEASDYRRGLYYFERQQVLLLLEGPSGEQPCSHKPERSGRGDKPLLSVWRSIRFINKHSALQVQ